MSRGCCLVQPAAACGCLWRLPCKDRHMRNAGCIMFSVSPNWSCFLSAAGFRSGLSGLPLEPNDEVHQYRRRSICMNRDSMSDNTQACVMFNNIFELDCQCSGLKSSGLAASVASVTWCLADCFCQVWSQTLVVLLRLGQNTVNTAQKQASIRATKCATSA